VVQQPLYARLAKEFIEAIATGRLRPGDRLPTEPEISRSHQVSRITVRHALDVLRHRGLIERFPGRGSFVASADSISVWNIRSVDDLVRAGAETEITILDWTEVAPSPAITERLLSGARGRVYRLRGIRRRGPVPLYYVEVHTPAEIGRQIHRHDLAHHTVLEVISDKLGMTVATGTEEISASVADTVLARRLRVRVGSPLLILEIIFFGVEGHPLEHTKAWYRADQFKRRNQLTRASTSHP
jgi:GntR family transcriptional regulator